MNMKKLKGIWLSSTGRGRGRPPPPPHKDFRYPKILSESHRKISITIEICKTIDFSPEKILDETGLYQSPYNKK